MLEEEQSTPEKSAIQRNSSRSTPLFVVLNPIGTVPLFIAITQNMKKEERKAVSKTAIITSGTVLVVFAIGGTEILNIFGTTIFSFMIAGGVLLFIVAIELSTHGVWGFGGGTLPSEEEETNSLLGSLTR